MDGDVKQPRRRQRDPRLVTDVTPEQGIVVRAFRSIANLVPRRFRTMRPEAAVAPGVLPATRRRFPLALTQRDLRACSS
jgi:hypothetical protein